MGSYNHLLHIWRSHSYILSERAAETVGYHQAVDQSTGGKGEPRAWALDV